MTHNDFDAVIEKMAVNSPLNDPKYVTLLSLAVLLITIVIFWCLSRRRSSRRSILLTGLCDSGKTLLFSRIIHSTYKQTHTSIKDNSDDYISNSGTLRVIDIPGHERLRMKYFDQHKGNAKGLVFLVDAVTFQKEIRDVAEYLYSILSDKVIVKNTPSLLILCNKQDQHLAKGSQVIKSLLEKEMNLVRMTKSNQLQSVDPSQSNTVIYLGKQGKDFDFSHLSMKVEVTDSSILNGDPESTPDIKNIENWLAKL